ncbi:MAG: Fe(3+) ABC transporter substrate-binding protein [Alphaproteobacteria bacterium]|nr:Fe(3+) ABC transporter substrate-binding protein [Alphaproteobacteria bacterium]
MERTPMKKLLCTVFVALVAAAGSPAAAAEVNIYSYRQPFLIKPFLDEFTKRSGIKVNVVFAKKGMLKRIQSEGRNTRADGILTADISRLKAHADAELLLAVKSAVLDKNIPAHLRDPEGRWFGLTKRIRLIATAKGRVKPGTVKSYEDLADPKLKGRICTRKGSHVYNRALLASMIAAHGEAKAQAWAKGLVANLARKPQGNDRGQIQAISQGVCDVAVINNYYYGKMKFNKKKPEQQAWSEKVDLVFPNQGDRGAHVNISGAAVTRYAKNSANMIKLLEFLSDRFAQQMYAAQNYEYPVNPAVATDKEVASWGRFREDTVSLGKIADLSPLAQKIVDRVGW